MLPDEVSDDFYWSDVYRRPLDFWEPTLTLLSRKHNLGANWRRARLGRNVVFLNADYVLNLSPPFWKGDIAREIVALERVAGHLPVDIPGILGSGSLDGWDYLIQRRLAGRNLHELWTSLSIQQRINLAVQHGEILHALHLLAGDDRIGLSLAFDWTGMYARQREVCRAEMAASGIHAALVDDVDRYLETARPLLVDNGSHVLLHGDLTHLNFLVTEDEESWRINGLIDWGDAKIGPRGHEFISPGVHMYLGDRTVIEAFTRGHAKEDPRELMARAMLYYTGEFAGFLEKIPGGSECRSWDCVARLMW